MSICGDCKFREALPGDCHVRCSRAYRTGRSPYADVMSILASVGRVAAPGPTEQVEFRPVAKRWPGCGSWPSCFDESIIVDCQGKKPE